jgi:hypothetical protein
LVLTSQRESFIIHQLSRLTFLHFWNLPFNSCTLSATFHQLVLVRDHNLIFPCISFAGIGMFFISPPFFGNDVETWICPRTDSVSIQARVHRRRFVCEAAQGIVLIGRQSEEEAAE